jgi:aspartyl aminopeptidase
MIGAYGQDDRVSAYTSLQAVLDIEKPQRTAICLFVDKEEIGSTGNTGLQSLIIENMMAELMHKTGQADYYYVRKALASSNAISADVNAAVDPNYPEVFEKLNCSFLSQGVVMTKFTGSRGKADSNDAHPEYLARLRRVFDEEGVIWQVGELGKVDLGGGGTVAQYMARYGMEVVDCGVALLGMHSPFEVASKADIYMAYKAYKAFWQKI